MDNLFTSAQQALKLAKDGDYQTEVFTQKIKTQKLSFVKNEIQSIDNLEDNGIAVRVYDSDGRQGFAYTSSINQREKVERMMKEAILSMKLGTPDPDFESLPEPKPLPNIKSLFDEEIAYSTTEDIIEIGKQIIEARDRSSVSVVLEGSVIMTQEERVLLNSQGIECSLENTRGMLIASAVAKNSKGAVASNSDLSAGRLLKDLKPVWLGNTVSKRACDLLGGKKTETMSVPVIFFSNVVYAMLQSIIGAAANADAVQKEKTYLVDKKGQRIASEKLTVIDDGIVTAGYRSAPFDGEGIPKRRQTIIENGVLRNYLYDTYTAKKDSVESTGNCTRASYTSIPRIKCNNLQIQPGSRNLDKLIDETKKGIFLLGLNDTPDSVSGRLSGLIREAFLIEDGEIKYPIKQAMIGINVFEFLKGISDVSKDYREEAGAKIPSLKIKKARIAGAK